MTVNLKLSSHPIMRKTEKEHCERVGALGYELSRKLGLSETTCRNIELAGCLHDIGKALVPYKILNKAGKLDETEFMLIKNHVIYGAYVVTSQNLVNKETLISILTHHENYDGTGYPIGLKGESIPIGGRILRICDMYDALTMDRPYRKKLAKEEAIKIMNENKSNFDIKIFDVFLQIIQ